MMYRRPPDLWDLFLYAMFAMTAAAWVLVALMLTGVI